VPCPVGVDCGDSEVVGDPAGQAVHRVLGLGRRLEHSDPRLDAVVAAVLHRVAGRRAVGRRQSQLCAGQRRRAGNVQAARPAGAPAGGGAWSWVRMGTISDGSLGPPVAAILGSAIRINWLGKMKLYGSGVVVEQHAGIEFKAR
jgi:hypothetical protein